MVALTGTVRSPLAPVQRSPLARIASTWSRHWSNSQSSLPAAARRAPYTEPIAPLPTIPIFIAADPPAGAPRLRRAGRRDNRARRRRRSASTAYPPTPPPGCSQPSPVSLMVVEVVGHGQIVRDRVGAGHGRAAAPRWQALLSLAGCGSTPPAPEPLRPPMVEAQAPGPLGHFKVGRPYEVNGRWYHPSFMTYYEATGIASWYGARQHGQPTANGETYDRHALTAAHPTLQLPSVVRVTNLANGRSLVLRVNDRGPFTDEPADRRLAGRGARARLRGAGARGGARDLSRRRPPRRAADPARRGARVHSTQLRAARARPPDLLAPREAPRSACIQQVVWNS